MIRNARHEPELLLAALVLGLLLLGLSCSGAGDLTSPEAVPAQRPEGDSALVRTVYDGDTVLVVLNGKDEKVRILGVDTPERPRKGKPGQQGNGEATEFTKGFCHGKEVFLSADSQSENRDRYGRLLRHLRLGDGRDLASELVRRGLAVSYPRHPVDHLDELFGLERAALLEGRGLWAQETMTSVSWRDAPDFLGHVVRVRGRIVKTHKAKSLTFLNFHETYEDHLSVVLFEASYPLFPAAPEAIFDRAEVEVIGRVLSFHGRPQIVVTIPEQIRLVRK